MNIRDYLFTSVFAGTCIGLTLLLVSTSIDFKKQYNEQLEKSKLAREVLSPPSAPFVFRNDNELIRTIYSHINNREQLYFDDNPSTNSLVGKIGYNGR